MADGYRFTIGKGDEKVQLLSRMSNRHGLIAGATGTGKTISLKVLAEHFSDIGVPVFLADVKGDLASLAEPGSMNDKLKERIDTIGLEGFSFTSFPVRLWDVYGKLGHPVRTDITEMGPILLARLLDLNEVQTGILHIAFRVADENGWLLVDLKDLRSMLQYLGDNRKEYSLQYGNISPQSIGAIQRSLLTLESQGGDIFFGEPSLEIKDLLMTDIDGKGIVNVLASQDLFNSPRIYSTFLLWLLSELFEQLPEVGDSEKPKIIFFFDEAHLLFNDTPKALLEKIELVVRLIRSKGVGVFFVTQNPADIPDSVLGQLGNRIQHALRAYTPKEQKAIKAAAETFRQNPAFHVEEVITQLKTGEALVSFLDDEGKPSVVEKALIAPPRSVIGTLDPAMRKGIINNSPMFYKYTEAVDEESAYEIIQAKYERIVAQQQQEKKAKIRELEEKEA
ncbi:MAG: helicase HerA-like domain-containing protein, partial [Bacillota bacterium]